ncbi:LysR family transcriptional regulator [Nocardioides sp. dk4132]|uniref:helix-turn-helix domain-containing protein n=1 Tax=unclassified Nocardioides TaxID=2615069 RepID=UPI0012962F9F|nr:MULTISPECIES: LysR family transcriptional regulator [unclassified Nocardioides]MQW75126.1 LysR family transcriptional regulator [Nocardioides sp. dk4132]QGA07707.1 LysR family transcriptional regulator [Nocardioides sp. dk884]
MARAEGVPTVTINQLAAFVAVTDAGTISGAAQQLHISASALSANLTELEADARPDLPTRLALVLSDQVGPAALRDAVRAAGAAR